MRSIKITASRRETLAPQRSNGRERVAEILQAATKVFQEHGYDSTTMKEIARRARARIGSLYHFFPHKEALAEALIQRYDQLLEARFDRLEIVAATGQDAELADALLDFLTDIHEEMAALITLLDSRLDWSAKRQALRVKALGRIATVLTLRAPGLERAAALDVAVVLLYNMKTMVTLTRDSKALTSLRAPEELRRMNRLYLRDRLGGTCC